MLDCASLSQPYIQVLSTPESRFSPTPFALTGDVLGAGVQPTFTVSNMIQTNAIAGVQTILIVQLVSNIDLPVNTTLTLTNMYGIEFVGPFPNEDRLNGCWESVTDPNQTSAKNLSFVLTKCDVSADNSFSLYVFVTNPLSNGLYSQVLVTASYHGCDLCQTRCGCEATSPNPFEILPQQVTLANSNKLLLIQYGSSVRFNESSNVTGQINTLTISLASNASILSGSSFTISGLNAIINQPATTIVTLTYGTAVKTVLGSFDSTKGALTFKTIEPIPPGNLGIEFVVENPEN